MSLRLKGKSPKFSEFLVTRHLKDGSVMFIRSLFRSFITFVSTNEEHVGTLNDDNKVMLVRAANMMKEIDIK